MQPERHREAEVEQQHGGAAGGEGLPVPGAGGVVPPHQDAQVHHVKHEQRADADQLRQCVDVHQQRQHPGGKPGPGGGVDGRLALGVHVREPRWQQPLAAQHHVDARLPQQRHQQTRHDPCNSAYGDNALRELQENLLRCGNVICGSQYMVERLRERGIDVDHAVGHHQADDNAHQGVQKGTHQQAAHYADRQIYSWILHLFCSGGDGVEANEAEEYNGGRCKHAMGAEGCKRAIVGASCIGHPRAHHVHYHCQVHHRHRGVETRRLLSAVGEDTGQYYNEA
mmetsp:Transcript_15504/g.46827  ORF Transcript_15504/g.46827 Transcript_15504/m.46827 type:complete len:282 (-) Transcript_15504:732-1577(-)